MNRSLLHQGPTATGAPRRLPAWVRWLALAAITAILVALTGRLSMVTAPPLPVLDDIGGEFRLASTRGGELTLSDLRGRPVLLNFGFTSCPDVCPTVLARMRAVLLDLAALDLETEALFVTIDPGRDDIESLRRYLGHFHPGFTGLGGSAAAIGETLQRYRVYVARETLGGGLDYGFVHSSHIYLIDAGGRVRAMFGATASVAEMVGAVRRLARERGATP